MKDKQGFTLVEIVVALAIIATSLLFLLTAIRQGLSRLEVCRSEFQSCLSMQTVVSAFSGGVSLPSDDNSWVAQESEPRPGLKIVRFQRENGKGASVWASKKELATE
ncbi:MAG: type II secretion system protein [Candidatus Omnitrophica bacterium]|nr:type II secretion system protein [Candidatus Omnitrophota bacterium]